MTNSIVAGFGEIGSGIGAILEKAGDKVSYHDPLKAMHVKKGEVCDVLHICFPYSSDFVQRVQEYIELWNPYLTIIHSTVKVGTTEKIGQDIVYSFARGPHPRWGGIGMESTMLQQTKHIGCTDYETGWKAAKYLQGRGFIVEVCENPSWVEYAKLWDTTYYGICILAHKLGKKMADSYDVPWDYMKRVNQTYNEGAVRVGHPEWIRPTLTPMEGPIGGHCIVPNAKILLEDNDEILLKEILEAK